MLSLNEWYNDAGRKGKTRKERGEKKQKVQGRKRAWERVEIRNQKVSSEKRVALKA